MQTSLLERTVFAAEWQAKQALRAGRRNDPAGFAFYANRMYDVLENAAYPRLATQGLVQLLGRAKAMVLKLDRELIKLALHEQAPILARHYQPVRSELINLC